MDRFHPSQGRRFAWRRGQHMWLDIYQSRYSKTKGQWKEMLQCVVMLVSRRQEWVMPGGCAAFTSPCRSCIENPGHRLPSLWSSHEQGRCDGCLWWWRLPGQSPVGPKKQLQSGIFGSLFNLSKNSLYYFIYLLFYTYFDYYYITYNT